MTEAYSDQDLAGIHEGRAFSIKHHNLEKIVAERQIANIQTRDREELKIKVIELCVQQKPYPIIVKLANNNTLDRTFIVDKRYNWRDAEAIWENIIFGYNQKGKEILKLIYNKLLDIDTKSREDGLLAKPQYAHIGMESLYAELDRRFGIKLSKEQVSDNAPFQVYRTTEEDAAGTDLNITTVMFDYIQEVGRVITKGNKLHRVSYIDYLVQTLGREKAELLIAGSIMNTEIPPASNRWDFPQGDFPPPQTRLR